MNLDDHPYQVEAKLLFSVIVAGKSAKFAEAALRRLIFPNSRKSPFGQLRDLIRYNILGTRLRDCRTGNYTKIEKAFVAIVKAKFNFKTVTPAELEKIHGIGPKTSRFFIMWIRPKEIYAALDVHVLRWMRNNGVPNVPPSTPSGERYAKFEHIFIEMAKDRNMTPRQLDELIWVAGSEGKEPPR